MSSYPFMIIRDAVATGDGGVRGEIVSYHRFARTAWAHAHRAQRRHQRINGPSSYLPISVIEVVHEDVFVAEGLIVCEPKKRQS